MGNNFTQCVFTYKNWDLQCSLYDIFSKETVLIVSRFQKFHFFVCPLFRSYVVWRNGNHAKDFRFDGCAPMAPARNAKKMLASAKVAEWSFSWWGNAGRGASEMVFLKVRKI